MITKNLLAFFILLIAFTSLSMLNACSAVLVNPPPDLNVINLQGTWISNYSIVSTDKLIINPDNTYRQIFENRSQNYVFDSGWNEWMLEELPNGVKRLHLDGGRYYLEGLQLAEKNGRKNPSNPCLGTDCTWGLQPRFFYDPFGDELAEMVDKLILVILVDSRGNLVLHHIWTSSDRGFLLFNHNREIFFRDDIGHP